MSTTATRPVVSDSDDQPPDHFGPRKLPIVIAAASVLIVLAVWVVAFSSALGARTVTVTGVHKLTPAEIRTVAAVGHGAPLIRLDTAAIRKRVEALPDVASASVSVSYPSTVLIRVTERVPVGYLAHVGTGGSSYVLVDGTGAQYREVATPPEGLPRFALPSGPSAPAAGHAATLVAAALAPSVLAVLSEISADSPQSVTLVLRDGRTVSWGSAERNVQKAALVPALLTQPGSHYDVSSPDLVVVR